MPIRFSFLEMFVKCRVENARSSNVGDKNGLTERAINSDILTRGGFLRSTLFPSSAKTPIVQT